MNVTQTTSIKSYVYFRGILSRITDYMYCMHYEYWLRVNDNSSRNRVLTKVKFVHQTLFGDLSNLGLRKWAKATFILPLLVVGNITIHILRYKHQGR